MRGLTFIACCLASLPALAGPESVVSEDGLDGRVTLERLPEPDHPVLATGARVWEGRCIACHSYDGLTGAPKITSSRQWASRIEKGLPVLFNHAINGFMGPRFLEMPPRGGDPDLSDDEVRAAVAFMVWASGGALQADAWLDTQGD